MKDLLWTSDVSYCPHAPSIGEIQNTGARKPITFGSQPICVTRKSPGALESNYSHQRCDIGLVTHFYHPQFPDLKPEIITPSLIYYYRDYMK